VRLADLLADVPTIHNYDEASGRCPRLDDEMLAFLDQQFDSDAVQSITNSASRAYAFALRICGSQRSPWRTALCW
jgi:hypothetical protein